MPRLILLTGLPGIGKTTVATSLPTPYFERLHFGGLLREVIDLRRGSALTHVEFREQFHRLVDAPVVHDAILRARECVSRSTAQVCILDSHAVSQTPEGLRATPDDLTRVKLLRFDGIVHLAAADCLQRVVENSRKAGRQPISEAEASIAEQMQLAVSVFYASAHDSPLLVVQATGEVLQTVQRIDLAIRTLLGRDTR